MPKFCKNCGTEIKDEGQFCPNCGKKVEVKTPKIEEEKSYSELIKEMLYNKENGTYRISKAKSVGIFMFLLILVIMIVSIGPSLLAGGLIGLVMVAIIVLIAGGFWYSICRGVGYLIRTYLIK